MTTTPDPKTVTAIAKAAMDYALRQCRDSAVEAALLASTSAPVLGREFDDLARATIAEYDRLGAVRTWPDEQPAAEQDGDEAGDAVREFLDAWEAERGSSSIRGGNGDMPYLFSSNLRAVLGQHDRLAARVAELEAAKAPCCNGPHAGWIHTAECAAPQQPARNTADGGADRG